MSDDARWYLAEDKAEAAETMVTLARRLRERQMRAKNDFILHASLFGGSEYLEDGDAEDSGAQLSLNVVRNTIETATSYIASKSRPKATFLTRGEWSIRRRARKLDKAIYGAMFAGGFYRSLPLQFRDACVFGDGWVHVARSLDGKSVVYDRVLNRDVIYDESEAKNAPVRSIYRVRYLDRIVAAETWPDAKDAIMDMATLRESDYVGTTYDRTSDQVRVWEAWHLRSTETSDDGLYLVALDGTSSTGGKPDRALVHRRWKRDRFPLFRYSWSPPLQGNGRGTGLAKELCGLQLEINDILQEVSEANHGVKGFWAVEKLSEVEIAYLNDEFDKVLEYTGVAPTYTTPSPVDPALYGYLWQLVAKAYEISGISQLAATSQKPAGLNSGAALRAYDDRQTDRFKHKYSMLEDLVVDVARATYDELSDIATDAGKTVTIQMRGDDDLEAVDFDPKALDDVPFELQIKPSSQLPTDLAGQMEFIQEFAKTGALDPEELLDLITSPDVDLLSKRKNATRRIVERCLEQIMDGGEYVAPEPELNLPLAARVAVEIYLQCRLDKAPQKVLDEIMRWIVQVRQTMKNNAPPPPAPLPPGGAPMLPPGAPPPPLPVGDMPAAPPM